MEEKNQEVKELKEQIDAQNNEDKDLEIKVLKEKMRELNVELVHLKTTSREIEAHRDTTVEVNASLL